MQAVRPVLVFFVLLFCMGASGNGDNEALGIIREFGFPIFVSLWFMWRVEKRLDRFTDAHQNLLTAVTIMAKTIDDWAPVRMPAEHHEGPVRQSTVTSTATATQGTTILHPATTEAP